jgi:hypothetical protein
MKNSFPLPTFSAKSFFSLDTVIKDDFILLHKKYALCSEEENSAKVICTRKNPKVVSIWGCVSVTADGNCKGRGMLGGVSETVYAWE